ncbi:HWE histidine kinase domain-containing protein [Rhizobium sp. SG570]|uniref:HWE histidine kinase domain-containing protein n=1 Tax=Rhizobium sp. SG570 TaxID=2587113 RepID=UPI001444FC78|nr:HWE histidine kinase domain-containing protein [Rhizobium sp. SG570]
MRHRVKNLFALASAIVSISARALGNVDDVLRAIQSRLTSLARAHELTMTVKPDACGPKCQTRPPSSAILLGKTLLMG